MSSFYIAGSTMQAQSFGYYFIGNIDQPGSLIVQHNANSRIPTGDYSYDAAGNLINLNNGATITAYTFNAESKLYNINTGADYFPYDALGQRCKRDTSGESIEYQFLNGQAIAEKAADGTLDKLHLSQLINNCLARIRYTKYVK